MRLPVRRERFVAETVHRGNEVRERKRWTSSRYRCYLWREKSHIAWTVKWKSSLLFWSRQSTQTSRTVSAYLQISSVDGDDGNKQIPVRGEIVSFWSSFSCYSWLYPSTRPCKSSLWNDWLPPIIIPQKRRPHYLRREKTDARRDRRSKQAPE